MTTQEKIELLKIIQEIQFNYRLEQFTDAALKDLLTIINKAQVEVLAQIEAKAANLTAWQEERSLALLDEWSDMQLGIRNYLGESIVDIASHAGAASYTIHNEIYSFSGLVNGFNNVALTTSQLQQILEGTPVGGKLISEWVASAFEGQTTQIRNEIAAGMLKGEGYPGLVRRFASGFNMTKDEAITICRSAVAAINVDAARAVAKANSGFMRGWRWSSVSENGAFYTKSGKGRGRGICVTCLALSAKAELYPLDGGPEIPNHPRCRCYPIFETKSWRELGIPVDEIEKAYKPYSVRGKGIDAETGEIIPQSVGTGGRNILSAGVLKGDYEDFFKQILTPTEQKMTIGPRRLELYQTGKIRGLGDLVTVEGGKARLLTLKELGTP